MNAKKLKTLRRTIRTHFGSWPLRALTTPDQNVAMVPAPGALNLDGTPRMVPFAYTGTRRNVVKTQRALYQACKRQAALGAV